MEATYDGDVVRASAGARERFYDSRGYGRPVGETLELDPVEAAHLLFRGDLTAVVDDRPTGSNGSRPADRRLDFRAFLASTAVSEVTFLVYRDLRDRGFYLSPTDTRTDEKSPADFLVYPRGQGPWDDGVEYRVIATGERTGLPATRITSFANPDAPATAVVAVVDEESELTYLECRCPTLTGSTFHEIPATSGDLLSDRVLVSDGPDALYDRAFYGQRLSDTLVQVSLVEAAHLADGDVLSVPGGRAAILTRGRDVEGDRFDDRVRAYSSLRTAGFVPKTGFKFGADFRTYAAVDSVADLGHAERLVRVLTADHVFAPRDLALDVRLAHGVRKRMTFGLCGAKNGMKWLSVERLTP